MKQKETKQWLSDRGITLEKSFTDRIRELTDTIYKKTMAVC